ncbi:MAG: LapA family protein [Nitrospirae bacterium]|jgi:uncharacterized integral membrane protein|nr:LapA family protein [Nitrospirota bacterium]
MRAVFWIAVVAAGLLFLLENDQQTVVLRVPFWIGTPPLPVGIVVILSILTGIVLAFLSDLLRKTRARLGKMRQSPIPPTDSDPHG